MPACGGCILAVAEHLWLPGLFEPYMCFLACGQHPSGQEGRLQKSMRPYSLPVRRDSGSAVLLANHFLPTFRRALGVSGKTALIVSTRADKHA